MSMQCAEDFKNPEYFFDGNYKKIGYTDYSLSVHPDNELIAMVAADNGFLFIYFDKKDGKVNREFRKLEEI